MTAPAPADAPERRRLHEELDRTLFVEAGAGTGKTTQLVSRIVQLVVTGRLRDIGGLAAITFTEAAAAELRHRVHQQLERAAAEAPEGSVERDRARRARHHLGDATIATLHGFATRLLTDRPVDAGLPPGFEVVDELSAEIDERERWAAFLDELFADPAAEPVLRRALLLGLTVRHLHEVGRAFADNWDRLDPDRFGVHDPAPVDVSPVLAALDVAIDAASRCTAGARSVQRTLAELPPFRDRLRSEAEPEVQLRIVLHEGPAFPSFGNASRAELVELRGHVEGVRAAVDGLLGTLRLDALEPLLARLCRHTLAGAAERRRRGRIRFHDLLVLARDLLASDARARRELARRHEVLLIDEFQDTDPLQVEIALLLALEDPASAPVIWHDAEVGEGRLCLVGDPKQSIYRFRRADIAVFERARRRYAGDAPVELRVNFRTVPSVVRWINAVFGLLIGPDDEPGQPAYRPLDAARAEPGGPPGVSLLGGEVDAATVAGLRAREAGVVADAVVAAVAGRWPVGEPGRARPARWGDVAVLIPSRAVLGELERALDAREVPYRVESRSLVFGSDEVRELLAVLQAVDDPADEVAVVAALRSPGFACPDDALARYRLAGGSWNPRAPVSDGLRAALGTDDPVLAALGTLAELHEERLWCPVNELVARVVRRLSLVELTGSLRRPRDRWRRIRLVLDEARAFVAAGGEALADFVARIEQQADERASRVESVVPDADDDAVRIATIHGSKGLEYPVVVLAGLGTEYRPPTDRVFWTADGPEIALGRQDGERFETPGYRRARRHEEAMDRAERTRLLYVGATRARDHLVVSLHHRPGRDSAARDLAAAVAAVGDGGDGVGGDPAGRPWHRWLVPPSGLPAVGGSGVDGPVVDGPVHDGSGAADRSAALASWRLERAQLLDAAARRSVTTPAELAGRGGSPPGPGEAAGERFGRRGRGATALGRAVHGTLQLVDLADPERDLAAIAAHQAGTEGIAGRSGLVEVLARSVVGSAAVRRAATARRRWREVFVSAPLGPVGTLIEGYVDLLYETEDGALVVVGYETDHLDATPDAAASHPDAGGGAYRRQGAVCAAVVGEAVGRPVERCTFVLAQPGGPAVERSVEDLPAAVAEVTMPPG